MKLTWIIAIILLSFSLQGCGESFLSNDSKPSTSPTNKPEAEVSYKQLDVHGEIFWRVGPNLGEPNTLIFMITDRNEQLVDRDDLVISASIRMPRMGHGAHPITITKIQNGIYELSDVIFSMPGFWHLKIQIQSEDTAEAVIWPLSL